MGKLPPYGCFAAPWIRRCTAQKQQKTASSRSRIAAFGHPPQTTGEQVFSYSPNVRTGHQSVDVGALVAGRLLGGVEAGDDVHHTAGGGHGMIAETLQEAAQQHDIHGLLTGDVIGQR